MGVKPQSTFEYDEDLQWDWSRLPAQQNFLTSKAESTCYSGAFGTGKTSALCAKAIMCLTWIPNNLGYMGRLDGKALRHTTLQTFEEMLDPKMIQSRNDQKGKLTLKKECGGSVLFYGDFRDFHDLKNYGLGFFAIDQMEEVPQEVWDMMQGRLRRKVPVLTEEGYRQWRIGKSFGTCEATEDGCHVAIDKRARVCCYCFERIPEYRETRNRGEKETPWNLILYPRFGFGVCNPLGPSHWIFKYFSGFTGPNGLMSEGLPGYEGFDSTMYDALNAGFVDEQYVTSKEMLFQNNPVMYNRYILGHWVEAEGLVYPQFSRSVHLVAENAKKFDGESLIDPTAPMFEFIDPGKTATTAVGWLVIEPCKCGCEKHNYWIVDEHYVAGMTVSYHAAAMKQHRSILKYHLQATFIDKNAFSKDSFKKTYNALEELTSIAELYSENDIFAAPAEKNWDVGYDRICQILQDDPNHIHPVSGKLGAPHFFVFSHCTNTVSEFENYKWIQQRSGTAYKEEPMRFNDHIMDGLNDFIATRPELFNNENPTAKEEPFDILADLDGWTNPRISFMGV